MPRSCAKPALAALLLKATTSAADNDLCTSCKDGVNQLVNEAAKEGCPKACSLIPDIPDSICSLVCSLIPTCGKGSTDCGDTICSAISICAHNPWMYESVWNFSKPTDTPTLDHEDVISLTSTEPSDDVPEGTVKIGIKCTAGTWWKAVTMFKGTDFLREVAHTQDHQGETNWGSVNYADLQNHYFSLSKAKAFGIHTNVYHITNAADMKERGTYLFEWSKDSLEMEPPAAYAHGNDNSTITVEGSCAKPGDCGTSYQACCLAYEAKGFPCTCHLKDGNGQVGSGCGHCGIEYQLCCVGFKAKGFPCTCDISTDGVVV